MRDEEILTFRPVDHSNYFAIMKLEMAPGQETFLDSNAWPLAEAAYVEGFTPEAVYLGETSIGLVSWGPCYPDYAYDAPAEDGSTIIDHVMIARPVPGTAALADVSSAYSSKRCHVEGAGNQTDRTDAAPGKRCGGETPRVSGLSGVRHDP